MFKIIYNKKIYFIFILFITVITLIFIISNNIDDNKRSILLCQKHEILKSNETAIKKNTFTKYNVETYTDLNYIQNNNASACFINNNKTIISNKIEWNYSNIIASYFYNKDQNLLISDLKQNLKSLDIVFKTDEINQVIDKIKESNFENIEISYHDFSFILNKEYNFYSIKYGLTQYQEDWL
ncbi:hypothetical protein [Mycoplasma sp. P36-A1]|uniref:hypothetical protein n=1 Tax=Mycoplasma sp. P36-A1 TaxID=3252900 RepID=UPI003C2DAE1D